MNITLITIGKTDSREISNLTANFTKRLSHYIKFDIEIIYDIKHSNKISQEEVKVKEGTEVLKQIKDTDILVLFDERGKHLSSRAFAEFIQSRMNASTKRLIFLIGGAYGFSESVYNRANFKISLSDMTFSHQMVRLFAIEQIYRAFTILNNEPYHHA